jgi:branched-chain amino acid transport system ATP-binding protein
MVENVPFLDVSELNVHYGGIHALRNINLQIARGEIASVIGANGAGKSTLLKTISSVKSFTSGSIRFNGKDLPKESFQVVKEGVTLVPEGRRIFGPLSVRENLMLGAYSKNDTVQVNRRMKEVFDLFPVLREREKQPGGTLSGGEQQMLAIGRALMSEPQLLLLDEPSLGLAPMIIDLVLDTIVKLNEETGLTILLVEQNAILALEISDHSFVLETGEIKMQGRGIDLLDDPRVKESYLGLASKEK